MARSCIFSLQELAVARYLAFASLHLHLEHPARCIGAPWNLGYVAYALYLAPPLYRLISFLVLRLAEELKCLLHPRIKRIHGSDPKQINHNRITYETTTIAHQDGL